MNVSRANPLFDAPPPQAPFNPHARIARLSSNIAVADSKKMDVAYIDSGATHNFFHSEKLFSKYEKINKVEVNVAKGKAFAIGRGTVTVNVGENIDLEGYHCPEFSSHILAAHMLSQHSDILFTSTPNKMCKLYKIGTVGTADPIWSTACVDGF